MRDCRRCKRKCLTHPHMMFDDPHIGLLARSAHHSVSRAAKGVTQGGVIAEHGVGTRKGVGVRAVLQDGVGKGQ